MGHGSGPAHRLTCAERLELQLRPGETHEVAATARDGSSGCLPDSRLTREASEARLVA